MHRTDGDRRVGQIIKARRELATHRVADRAWLNGRGSAVQILATRTSRLRTSKQCG
jgi:hypothetical protein